MQLSGKATVLGDDIDTDVIYPGRYLAVLDPVSQSTHLFESLPGDLRKRVGEGGVIVAGWNFGCGSSREHAVTSMLGAGVRLVVARSFSRIYFRNAINNGLAVVTCPQLVDLVADGDGVEVDLAAGLARCPRGECESAPLAAPLLAIVSAGGLWASVAANRDTVT